MRKIINSTYISLDGMVENPQDWPALPSDGGRGGAVQTDLLLSCDTLLMGRRTYEGFAPVWPTRSGDPYSDHINAMRKYVVSGTLRDPRWHNTEVIDGHGDVPGALRRLKESPGENIVQYGYGPLTRTLLEHGLLDELRLWMHPFLLGTGSAEDRVFRPGPTVSLELTGTTTLDSGIVILSYRPAGAGS